jgi:hypothetical protein
MSKETSLVPVNVSDAVKKALLDFFRGLGREIDALDDDLDLLNGTGATSDEGIDFAIDLSNVLHATIPNDFNPFVHSSGKRGMTLRELIDCAGKFAGDSKETGNAN